MTFVYLQVFCEHLNISEGQLWRAHDEVTVGVQARLVGWTAQVNILYGNEVSVRFCVILEPKLGSNEFHTGRALSGRNQSDEPRTSLQNIVDFKANWLASVLLKVLREKHVVLGRIHDEVKVRL